MAYFYRYTDAVRNPTEVFDMQLNGSYGDLSDGESAIIKVNPGLTDSNLALFQFPIANKYRFGAGEVTGFAMKFKTVPDDVDDTSNLQGTQQFGLMNVFMHKKGAAFEGGKNGDVQQLGENYTGSMNQQYLSTPTARWQAMDLMAYLTSMDDAFPYYKGFYEDFEGTSDVDTTIDVTQGAVRKKGDPYITLDVAHDSVARQAAGVRLSKRELSLFYGTDFQGQRIIKLKKDGKKWKPLTKKGQGGGLGPAWAAAGLPGATAAVTSSIDQGAGVGGKATVYAQSPSAYEKVTYTDRVAKGKMTKLPDYTTSRPAGPAGELKAGKFMRTFDKYTGGAFRTASGKTGTVPGGKLSGVTKAARFGVKRVPVVGTVVTLVSVGSALNKRNKALADAEASGDVSGLQRPMRDPVWYSKASWKNMHVGEKGIEGHIKYSYETVLNPLEQKDSMAMTTTSSWWDQVREVTDYAKSEVTKSGVEIAYVGNEDMAAKSSINFHTGDSIAGQSMEMRAYADYDANQLPRNQEAMNFSSGRVTEQQDIFVSKRLPTPKTMFAAKTGAAGHTTADAGNRWELSLDMKVCNGWTPYTYGYNGTSEFRNSLRRTIAITFGTKKPQDNQTLTDYLESFTDGSGTYTAGEKVTGVYMMPSMDFSNGVAADVHINPISTYTWNTTDVVNTATLGWGLGSFANDQILQTTTTNGSYGAKITTGKWMRLKFSTTPLGASGVLANADGSGDTEDGNEAKHQGRFWLTLHDPETDEVLDVSSTDDTNYGYGTTSKGPINLTAPNDPINAFDNQASNYRYAHNLGFHDGRDADGAGTGDGNPDDHCIWTPYFTIWVCNHRWNSTGSPSFDIAKKGSDNATANNVYKHDVFQKAVIKQDQAVALGSLVPDTYYANAVLSDMRLLVDQIALKGVEADVVNMSVNDQNISSGQENIFNRQNSKLSKYYVDAATTSNAYFYQDALGTPSYSTKQKDIKSMVNMPTVLSLGFTLAAAQNWNNNNLSESGGDTHGACSTSKPTFLLFNDFISNKLIPSAIADNYLAASYSSALTAGFAADGDWDGKHRLCGDSIDLFGRLGSSTSANPFVASQLGNLTIGNTAGNDIVTGNSETDAWDRNRSTSHKVYMNNFQNKGFLQFQKDLIDASTFSAYDKGWVRRENIYASTHVIKAKDITSSTAKLTLAQPDVLYRNTIIDDDCTNGHELFILFQYGRPLSFATDTGDVSGEDMGTCIIGTIERDGDEYIFTKVKTHSSQSANNEWHGHTSQHSGEGGNMEDVLEEKNMPRMMISPYRCWIDIQIGLGPNGAAESDQETLDGLEPRGYGSIVPVKRPRKAGTDSTYGGFALGPTFNESRWYVNTSDQNPYYSKASYDIQEMDTAYHKDLDFGHGTYQQDTGIGGQVTNFRADYSRNDISLDNLLIGAPDLAASHGKPVSFIISPSGSGDVKENAMYIHSSKTTNDIDKPKFITEFFDDIPPNPGVTVEPFEEDQHYPLFRFAIGGEDVWHNFLMVDEVPISSKFHRMVAYAPLNENLDRWEANVTYDVSYTPAQIKCYNHEDYIGKEIFSTTFNDIKGRLSYVAADGFYNGSGVSGAWSYAMDTCEGLDGHAKIGGGEFIYGLYPATADDSYGHPNSKTHYRTHFSAQGIFTFNSAMSTNNYTMMAHGADTDPVWMVYYDGTNKQVVARAYWSGTGYVELKSTTAPLLDDVTPMHVAIVLDTELLEGNFKMYINGVLEDQTGKALATGTTNNWDYGNLLYAPGSATLVIGMPMGAVPEGSLSTIEWTGKVEEVMVHSLPLYFFPAGADTYVYTKELEEVMDNLTGEAKSYNARLFTMDYHNIRDPVASSNNINWKIPSFNIDGT